MKKGILITIIAISIVLFGCGQNAHQSDNTQSLNEVLHIPDVVSPEGFSFSFEKVALCENVQQHTPIGITDEFTATNAVKVYLYIHVNGEQAPGKLIIRWNKWREQIGRESLWQEVHTFSLNVPGKDYRTYAYKTVSSGLWRIDIIAPDGSSIVWTKVFPVWSDDFTKKDYIAITSPTENAAAYDSPEPNIHIINAVLARAIDKENNYALDNPGTHFYCDELIDNALWLYVKYTSDMKCSPILQWSKKQNGEFIAVRHSSIQFKDCPEQPFRARYFTKITDPGEYKVELFSPSGKTMLWEQYFDMREGMPGSEL